MKKIIDDIKSYWWLVVPLLSTMIFCVVEWQKIEGAYLTAHKNEKAIEILEDELGTKTNALDLRLAITETDMASIKASLERIENKLDEK